MFIHGPKKWVTWVAQHTFRVSFVVRRADLLLFLITKMILVTSCKGKAAILPNTIYMYITFLLK